MDMSSNARHIVRQRRVVGSLLGTAARALVQRLQNGKAEAAAAAAPARPLPGPELVAEVQAPAAALVRDYVRHVGGDPGVYLKKGAATVPPHLFPQWTFPLAARVMRDVPYPLLRILNSGCRLEVNAPVAAGERLTLRAQLAGVTEDERRAVVHQRIVTSTAAHPRALVVDLYAVVPRGAKAGNGATGPRRAVASLPASARELAAWTLRPDAGLQFAFLTGDFNPVHWVRRYARAAGFRSPILHGFSMMARTMESLGRTVLAGGSDRITMLDVKFTRPLPLGRGVQVGLYLDSDGRSFYLADAPGGRAYLVGSFDARPR